MVAVKGRSGPPGHAPYPGCEKGGETGGRPRTHTDEFIDKQADALKEWMRVEENIWLNDFCLEQGLNPDLMSEWASRHARFAGAFLIAKRFQESKINKGALRNTYNSTMAKMNLTNHHGWSDKTETKVSGDAEHPFACLFKVASQTKQDMVESDEKI